MAKESLTMCAVATAANADFRKCIIKINDLPEIPKQKISLQVINNCQINSISATEEEIKEETAPCCTCYWCQRTISHKMMEASFLTKSQTTTRAYIMMSQTNKEKSQCHKQWNNTSPLSRLDLVPDL